LNLRDGASLLYQVAMALYTSKDAEKSAYYRQPGGQKLAVADALTIIASRKLGARKDTEKERLKRQLLREKRKKSPVGEGSGGRDESRQRREQPSAAEVLDEVINERRAYQSERGA